MDRHLLPQEIDLLLDNEVGFGVQPLRAHVRQCSRCRAELEEARLVVAELEHLPHFVPSTGFADRVMAQVQVFEPAHVAAVNSVRRWVPQSRPARALTGAAAAMVAMVLSVGALWLGTRIDAVVFFSGLVVDRARRAMLAGLGDFIGATLGQPALDALRTSGPAGVALGLTGLVLAVATAVFGLRALALASRRHRS
ncbi:MAG: hypothetical protein ACJ8AO_02105 [Gemmatimonadaceae bacterium]